MKRGDLRKVERGERQMKRLCRKEHEEEDALQYIRKFEGEVKKEDMWTRRLGETREAVKYKIRDLTREQP